MKTSIQVDTPEQSASISHLILVGILLCTVPGLHSRAACAYDSFQYNALFDPTQAQLTAEQHGRVMIYDGLDSEVVERALDEQFDRIEHMMFIRTQQMPTDGEDDEIVEDDGC